MSSAAMSTVPGKPHPSDDETSDLGEGRTTNPRQPRSRSRSPIRRLLPVVLALAVLVGMVLSTKFLTPEEETALNPAAFDAKVYAAEQFPQITERFQSEAVPLTDLVPAVEEDPAAAAEEFEGIAVSGDYAFPVRIEAEVAEVDANFMLLSTPDLGADIQVRVPVGTPLNGTPVRDAAGIQFADFTDQTQYQSVANEFKILMQQDVLTPADPPSLQGQTIEVVGAYTTGGPPQSYIVQPVSIEAAGR